MQINPEVNVGHLLIVVSMLGSGIAAYVAAKVELTSHASRIDVIEKTLEGQSRLLERQSTRAEDMNNNVWGIKQDMAIIRQKVEMFSATQQQSRKQ